MIKYICLKISYAQENQLTGDIIIPENSKLEIL